MKNPFASTCILFLLAPLPAVSHAQDKSPLWHLTVHADKPGAKINPNFYGLMTEEINHAYDGGLYGELIQNRSFRDDANQPIHWSVVQGPNSKGDISLDHSGSVSDALNSSLKLEATTSGEKVGVANEGYWGIPVFPKTAYKVSFYAKSTASVPLYIELQSDDGKTKFAGSTVYGITSNWKKFDLILKTGRVKPSLKNRFIISTIRSGTTWLSLVSLFPPTYKHRPNGNRIDLMEKLAAMKPSFLRFPGGNYVDPGHYEWKKTIGPVENRPLGRHEWGYPSSYGFGLLEFLLWCEELKIEPVLAVTDGRPWLPADGDVTPLVQDALDEIEYVSGDAKTTWGARRAADGHPKPFKLRYVEIGNEDFFDKFETYNARFARFHDAIRAKYSALQIIATRGDVSSRRPDIVDDHIYANVPDMLRASRNYDHYDRSKPKIFVGEWATTVGSPTGTLQAALSDAAYLSGLERNADVVTMACYAPLLVNVNPGARQWGTNLIGYDALHSFGGPSYYVQSMFNAYKGDVVLPIELSAEGATASASTPSSGGVGIGTWDTQAEFKDASVTQNGQALPLGKWKTGNGDWAMAEGTLAQSGNQKFALASNGQDDWTNYSFQVKARKVSGNEGFVVFFHIRDARHLTLWNVGGWGNTRSALQTVSGDNKNEFGQSDLRVETGRWYDVRVDVQGLVIRCYLDGKLITTSEDQRILQPSPIYTCASRDSRSGDVVLKVVNVSDASQTIQFDLKGIKRVQPKAKGLFLMGHPDDVNSLAEPEKVIPEPLLINKVGKFFKWEFSPNSVSVFRLRPH